MARYFEFQDSKSYKFWQIEVEGKKCIVRYGKIGTDGQEKISEFGSEELAQKESAKLVNEKTKKGYVEKVQASSKKVSRRISVNYDEAEEGKTLVEKVKSFIDSDNASDVESLVIGAWEESFENGPQEALDVLVANADKLPKLRELFVGDMDSEECEVSWIIQADYAKLLRTFTNLESLHIKGSTNLSLGKINSDKLKSLTIECGGLPVSIIENIAQSTLPSLEKLMLYIGVEDYGFDGSVKDLKPFMEKGRFPKLTYLGLTDSEIADEIAVAIADASVLDQLETLDLSMGVMTEKGADALLQSKKILSLKKLDLHYHYIPNDRVKQLKALPIIVDVSEQQDLDEEWRYPAVTE